MRLSEDERRAGIAIAVGVTVALALIWRPWASDGSVVGFALGAAFPAALFVAARLGHRVWTAIAAFIVALDPAWGYWFILGAVPLVYAFWLAWRGRQLLMRGLNDSLREPPART